MAGEGPPGITHGPHSPQAGSAQAGRTGGGHLTGRSTEPSQLKSEQNPHVFSAVSHPSNAQREQQLGRRATPHVRAHQQETLALAAMTTGLLTVEHISASCTPGG